MVRTRPTSVAAPEASLHHRTSSSTCADLEPVADPEHHGPGDLALG